MVTQRKGIKWEKPEPRKPIDFHWLDLRKAADHFENLVFQHTGYTVAELRMLVHIAEHSALPKRAHWWGLEETQHLIDLGYIRIIDGEKVTFAVTGVGHVRAHEARKKAEEIDDAFYLAFGSFGEYGYEYHAEVLPNILNLRGIVEE